MPNSSLNFVSDCALVGLDVTAATPLLQVDGRLCWRRSKMKSLTKYKE